MLWGYALVWMPQYLTRDSDPILARLKFLKHYDLKVTGIGLEDVPKMSHARRDIISQYLADNDLYMHFYVHPDYLNPDLGEVKRQVDEIMQNLEKYQKSFRTPLVTTGVGNVHRFMRKPSLAEQLERLSEVLPLLAKGCRKLGLPFGIENHGDYYCSDLVPLCQQTPELGIFLDTGNTYLVGETPLPAFQAAAPYTVGTHFKDHHVCPRPEARPLHFEVGPSVIGDGDVPLEECYQLLVEKNPAPDKLVMEIEFIPPEQPEPVEAVERSIAFIKSLEKGAK